MNAAADYAGGNSEKSYTMRVEQSDDGSDMELEFLHTERDIDVEEYSPLEIDYEELEHSDAPGQMLRRARGLASEAGAGRLNDDSAKILFRRFGAAMDQTPGMRKPKISTPNDIALARLGGYTGSKESFRDPKSLGGVLDNLLRSRGWQYPVSVAGVTARWSQLVGEYIAEHTEPTTFKDGVLTVQCDSTAHATQLKIMRFDVLAHMNRELGEDIVRGLNILGPNNGRWRSRGGWRVQGGRGVRDTYG